MAPQTFITGLSEEPIAISLKGMGELTEGIRRNYAHSHAMDIDCDPGDRQSMQMVDVSPVLTKPWYYLRKLLITSSETVASVAAPADAQVDAANRLTASLERIQISNFFLSYFPPYFIRLPRGLRDATTGFFHRARRRANCCRVEGRRGAGRAGVGPGCYCHAPGADRDAGGRPEL